MIIVPLECGNHQKKLEIPVLQQPRSQSMSELKPPTMNSSFLLNGMSSPRLEENNHSSLIQYSNRAEETEIKAMKKSKFHEEMLMSKQSRIIFNNQLVKKFTQNLKHTTFLLKDKLLNYFQQKILTEKYLESDILEKVSKLDLYLNITWEIIFFIVQVIAFIYLPFEVGFKLKKNYLINSLVIIQIVVDILIYSVQKEKCKKLYLIDSISIISNGTIIISDEYSIFAIFFQLLASLSKFQIKFQKWQDYIPYDLYNSRFIARIFVLIHYFACIWHLIGITEEESWITELNIESDVFTRYCYSIYCSSASLLHIGNLPAKSPIEQIYSVFIMCISCWILVAFFEHKFQCNSHDEQYRKQIKILNTFFQDKKISFLIKSRIRSFLRSNFTEANEKQITNIMSQLSPQLSEELLYEMRTDALSKCNLLQRFSSLSKEKITKYMDYITLSQNKIMDIDCSLYLIQSGKIQVIEYGKAIQQLESGQQFGQFNFFSGIESQTQFKVLEQAQLFQIKMEDFVKIINQNKSDSEKFMFIKDQVLNGNCSVIDLFCNFCQSGTHTFSNCSFLNYKPNLQNLVKKASSGTQERIKFTRDRDINHRLLNQVFNRLEINYESLSQFRMKMNLSFLEDSSEELEEEISEESSEQYTNNRTSDNYKDGYNELYYRTAISILKNNDYVNENMKHSVQEEEEIIKITSNQEPHLKEYGLQLPQFQVPLISIDNTKKSQTAIDQSQQILSDWNIPSVTKIKQASKNDLRQSARKLSSKLSTIKHIQSGTIQNFKSNVNPYSKSNLQLPNSHELVDLSMYNKCSSSEEFEVMFEFTIYYPSWNYSNVIQRLNYQLKKRFKKITQKQFVSICQSNSQLQEEQ